MTNRTKIEFTSHCRIAAKTNFFMLFSARFAHARYSSRMILNWGDHGKLYSGKIKGRCQPPPPHPPCVIFKRELFTRGVLNIPGCVVYVPLETTGGAIKTARRTTNHQ